VICAQGQPRPPLTKRMRRRHWMAIDFVVAGILALSCLLAGIHSDSPGSTPVAMAYAGVVFLAVGLRRRGPLPAFGVLAAVAALATVFPRIGVTTVALLAMAYVLYLVTVTSPRSTSIAGLGLSLAEMLGIVLAIHNHHMANESIPGFPGTLALVVAWMTGYSVRQRRAYVEMLQVQAASSAVAEERLRIARELHDVVAHSMSVIAVQAGFGQYVIDASPANAREALGAIQATSRDALAELRRMLGVLRQQDASPSSAPLTPECGLGELDGLVRRTAGAGIEVRLSRTGTVRELPAGIDVSAYRIIQESLTNVVRHAGSGARCEVAVSYGPDVVGIEVTDGGGPARPGPAAHCPGSGHGLIGMRERVSLCGGQLTAGPLSSGGFRVSARLPVPVMAGPELAGLAAAPAVGVPA
jgi:signal transduction histidine kinase